MAVRRRKIEWHLDKPVDYSNVKLQVNMCLDGKIQLGTITN